MPKRLSSYMLAVTAGLSAVVILLGPHRALAAGDCLAQPDDHAAATGHWYYRLDRINNRKCWHFVGSEPATPPAEAADVQPSPTATPQPTVSSFFSALIAGFTPANPAAAQAAPANSDENRTQADPPKDPKNGEASRVKRSRPAAHDNATLALAAKPQRQSPALPRADQGKAQPAPPLTEAERAELFRNFVRWKNEQLLQPDTHAAGLE
jgi:hypothetical protein